MHSLEIVGHERKTRVEIYRIEVSNVTIAGIWRSREFIHTRKNGIEVVSDDLEVPDRMVKNLQTYTWKFCFRGDPDVVDRWFTEGEGKQASQAAA